MADIDDAFRLEVLRVLSSVPALSSAGLHGHRLHLEPLAGGVGRRSYTASIGGEVFVVRAPCDAPPGVLDFATEVEIVQEAAALDIAPAVVASDAAAGILITEYRRAAQALTPEATRLPDNIVRIAALVKRLHRIRRDVRGFDPEAFAAEYVETLGGMGALHGRERKLAEQFRTLAREYRARFPRIVLCHNDLFASNVLDDGRLWLIDFEYAVMAAPVLDLAGLAAANDYGRHERLQLAEAYYADSAVPFSAAELDKVVRLVRVMAYFWALASARRAADPTPYTAMAERFVAALA